jgi:hypothetical protein
MLPNQFRGPGVMHDHRARCRRDPLQHGIAKVALVGRGGCTLAPQLASPVTMPFAIVIDEFVHIPGFVEGAEEQVLQDGVVQDDNAGALDSLLVDRAVELIVADVVEVHVGAVRIGPDVAELLQRAQQGC